jgi:hypothetical protein
MAHVRPEVRIGGAVRKLVFTALLITFTLFTVYGLATYHYEETISNGAMICLSCIGVGG